VAMLLGIQFPLAVDEDWSALGRYWVRTVGRPPVAPAFFIDARGNVRAIFSGETMTESDASKMETLVVELIREARTPPPTATP